MRSYIIGIAAALTCLGLAVVALCDIPNADSGPGPAGEELPWVSVTVDGSIIGLPTSAATVGDLLHSLGITLGPLDRTSPSPDTPISHGLEVWVTRVTCHELSEACLLPAKTVVLSEPDLPAGYTKILAHGRDGLARRTWRIWEKDGKETSRGLVNEQILVAPTDTVVLRGTHGLPTRGGNWRRPLVMTATAYDPGPRSCGRYADGYTATGVKAQKGVVAVDDRIIPMGTRLYIPGYGFAVAADRGSAIRGMRIDLCYNSHREAKQFGRRKVKVYLLD